MFDYSDAADTIKRIKELTDGGVSIGLDTISEPSTYAITLKVFRAGEKGILNVINPPPSPDLLQEVPDLQVAFSTMFTLFGQVSLLMTHMRDDPLSGRCSSTCSPSISGPLCKSPPFPPTVNSPRRRMRGPRSSSAVTISSPARLTFVMGWRRSPPAWRT